MPEIRSGLRQSCARTEEVLFESLNKIETHIDNKIEFIDMCLSTCKKLQVCVETEMQNVVVATSVYYYGSLLKR